jgi:hypothetical protein
MKTYTQFLDETYWIVPQSMADVLKSATPLHEVFGQPFKWFWSNKTSERYSATFNTTNDTYLVRFYNDFAKDWEMTFFRHNDDMEDGFNISGTGEAFKVFATVIDVIKAFLKHEAMYTPERGMSPTIYFTAKEPSRMKLYDRLIQMVHTEIPGYEGVTKHLGSYSIRKNSHLHEKFLKGQKGAFDYTDVFEDPTREELKTVGHRTPAPIGTERYGRPCLSVGGILTPQHLYAFNRETAEHREVAFGIIESPRIDMPKIPWDWVPIYLLYFPQTETVDISFASFSASHLRGKEPTAEALVMQARSHPAFKIFKQVVGPGVR